jgi:uncharacterized protein (TIGR03083 family)
MTDLREANCTERLALADLFASLDETELDTPSLCAGWSVGDVLAHLVTPYLVSPARVVGEAIRRRGFAAAMVAVLGEVHGHSFDEQVEALRAHADRPFVPPLLGLGAPLTDAVVHGEDARVPLGRERDVPGQHLRAVLDFGTSWRASPVFIPRGRLSGLRLVATDLDWSHGSGDEVRGPAVQLVRSLYGRIGAATGIEGPGAATLRARVGHR